jgi:hypothetical protein
MSFFQTLLSSLQSMTPEEMLSQAVILFTGLTAVILSQSLNTRSRKWSPIFGMLGQPAWLWAAAHSHQWGMFLVSLLYCYGWGKGLWNHWIAPWRNQRRVTILWASTKDDFASTFDKARERMADPTSYGHRHRK